ncbi:MAG TPA: recombinase XerD [Clostridiales bacterium]|jgi:site-specific recombinase XerD|nr:recombinase XerD [Clostridiales bacterium]HBX87208.1 recombinase XerD [Marinilabiliaceae bacterium]
MKNKTLEFMDLLENFFTEYMPYSKGLSQNTIRSYKYSFRLLIEYLFDKKNISANDIRFKLLDFDTINSFLLWLETERKSSVTTRNLRLTALSSFGEYTQNRNIDAATVFMNAVKRVPVKTPLRKSRTVFTRDEVSALINMPDSKTKIGMRNKMLLNLMYASGARAQETCDLVVRNVQFQDDNAKLTITGKGGKTRRIIIARPCAQLLKEYLIRFGIVTDLNRHIFSSQTNEHMSISCIEEIFRKYLGLAKKQYPTLFREYSYSPHTMRHSTATHMLEAGVPIMVIKNFLGHSSITTTERYAELSQGSINRHIIEWNQRWFPTAESKRSSELLENGLPDFLT